MRLAPHGRFLATPSSHSTSRSVVRSRRAGFCQHYSQSRNHTAKEKREGQLSVSYTKVTTVRRVPTATKDDRHVGEANERSSPDAPTVHARSLNAQEFDGAEDARNSRSTNRQDGQMGPVIRFDAHSSNFSSRPSLGRPSRDGRNEQGWKSRLMTLEQYERESHVEGLKFRGHRLVDDPSYTLDWDLWLELITFRRRHHGTRGTTVLYKEIIRRDLQMPTEGFVANQLWDLLIRAGFHDIKLLEETVIYARRLKVHARRSWSKLYYGIVSITLKKDPKSAYTWHVKLKDDFPPSLEDYLKMFKISLECGRLGHFSGLYQDNPLIGMYKTVTWHLCESQMYAEALYWHDLLCETGDFPTQSSDVQPLLDHLIHIKDRARFGKVIRQLPEAERGISNMPDHSFRRDTAISREIMSEQLGEVHGVAPKSLNDSFCARLFATRLFSIDTLIKGLHMIATETIGPLSLREIALRTDCDPGAICQHIDSLRTAGISLENCAFCTVVRSLAVENKREILQSVVSCDLHPDTFADCDLQERLLAQYYDEHDLVKVERTLAVLTNGRPVKNLQLIRMNLILRCQVTLGMRAKALATLEEMKRMGVPASPRSSRHLRVHWLSKRQVGRGPDRTQELAVLIEASRMTMQSGRLVPIIAWREILRRLGMAGRLTELENLALWLVDWYSRPVTDAALRKRVIQSNRDCQAPNQGRASRRKAPKHDSHPSLNTLFTVSAQHAIVAWGFQHSTQPRKTFRRFKNSSTEEDRSRLEWTTRFRWTWGLHLLHKLRERGLSVQRGDIARVCRQRLNVLFGAGFSTRRINRLTRTKAASESHSKGVYVRKMEEIWGEDLFRTWSYGNKRRKVKKRMNQRILHRPIKEEYQASTDSYDAV